MAKKKSTRAGAKHSYQVLTRAEAIRLGGLSLASIPRIKLNPRAVPRALRSLIPLAEKFGIDDDILRDMAVEHARRGTEELIQASIRRHTRAMCNWLAGPSSKKPPYSPEYLAFSNLWMI